MWEKATNSQGRRLAAEASPLERENESLRQENARLQQQARDIAEVNAHAAELIAQRDEAYESLEAEMDRRRKAEAELGQVNRDMEERVRARTAELTAANDGFAKEICDHQDIEQTLRENEQRLNTVLHDILTGVLIVDAETHEITDANPHACEIIGLPREQIVGRVCHKFVCPAEQGSCPIGNPQRTVDQSARVLLRADGRRVPILKTVTAAQWQGRKYFIESFIDMSVREKAEEQLQESLALLRATLESTADGILVVDRDGRIKDCNTQFKRLTHIPDELLESGDDKALRAFGAGRMKDPDQFMHHIRELKDRPEEESLDTIEFIDGTVLEWSWKPYVLDGRIIGRVVSLRDVTERHHAQKQQEALMHQVAAANEELTHFAYVVSHDLKAPLRGIKLLTDWLCADYGDQLGDDAKEQLNLLQNRVGRMHSLIEGVLQYSRIGRTEADKVTIDLNALLREIVDDLAPPEHIRVSIEGPLPTVRAEKTGLSQVFQNLLSNAIKYLDKPQGRITVACAADGAAWRFSVADNGPGIEAKYFERIFRIFQTLAPKDEFESTGVGLTLVKKIVEQYGGRIWIESEVGRGSTFFFTLPQDDERPPNEPQADDAVDPTRGPMTDNKIAGPHAETDGSSPSNRRSAR